jgi:hypothetical protein
MSDYCYTVPIQDDEHFWFLVREAQRRYNGLLIADEYRMLLVVDDNGITHTDAVLRACSIYSWTDLAVNSSQKLARLLKKR